MKTSPSTSTKTVATRLMSALLIVAGTTVSIAQQNQIEARPLTHQEIHDYALPEGTRPSGGLLAVGVGQPAYLEAQLSVEEAPYTDNVTVTNVDWQVTLQPAGGTNDLQPSPLNEGTNGVPPIYEPRSRIDYVIAGGSDQGRRMLVPTVDGEYMVTATVMTDDGGSVVLSQSLRASTYVGATTCLLCHSGGQIPDKSGWADTGHATFFTEAIDGLKSSHYNSGCIDCHVVGYDTDPLAVNGGFDDVAAAAQPPWTFPTELTNGNWAAMPNTLKQVSNIQCENCHGAGMDHAVALGNTNATFWPRIAVDYNSGDCAQCHSEKPYHVYPLEWETSKHAVAVREERSSCAGCHQGVGFIDRMDGVSPVRTDYAAINCSTCHDPHSADNPHQIRSVADVTLKDTSKPDGPTVVTEGGNGKLCMQCHISRRDAVTYVEKYHSHYGPHHGPQTDMLVGANAITYDSVIPSSSHYTAVEGTCATCHMNEHEDLAIGGHAMSMKDESGVEMISACTECHGSITSFDFPRKDYDEDGVIEGVQTEVHGLMEQLGMLLPPYGSADVVDDPDWTSKELKAAYNYLFVEEDGSHGAHNLSYTVGILKASIQDLKGNPKAEDANSDGLPDAWQVEHFDSIYSPYAARNFAPAGDDMPNWLKYSLGLDPWTAVEAIPDGYVYAQGKQLGGTDDTLYIYTAAEIAFDTEVGKTYQIQETSEISAGWQDIGGDPIVGTGNAVSYITPTRGDVQQYFRVVITP